MLIIFWFIIRIFNRALLLLVFRSRIFLTGWAASTIVVIFRFWFLFLSVFFDLTHFKVFNLGNIQSCFVDVLDVSGFLFLFKLNLLIFFQNVIVFFVEFLEFGCPLVLDELRFLLFEVLFFKFETHSFDELLALYLKWVMEFFKKLFFLFFYINIFEVDICWLYEEIRVIA